VSHVSLTDRAALLEPPATGPPEALNNVVKRIKRISVYRPSRPSAMTIRDDGQPGDHTGSHRTAEGVRAGRVRWRIQPVGSRRHHRLPFSSNSVARRRASHDLLHSLCRADSSAPLPAHSCRLPTTSQYLSTMAAPPCSPNHVQTSRHAPSSRWRTTSPTVLASIVFASSR
jgi:hypothetical protein